MDSVVIDTDVLSYLFKQDTRGELYRPHIDGKLGVLSFNDNCGAGFLGERAQMGTKQAGETVCFPRALHDY